MEDLFFPLFVRLRHIRVSLTTEASKTIASSVLVALSVLVAQLVKRRPG